MGLVQAISPSAVSVVSSLFLNFEKSAIRLFK